MRGVGAFLGTAFAGYLVAFLLSPGYVYSGYRARFAPLTVFHSSLICAFVIYALVVVAVPRMAGAPRPGVGVARAAVRLEPVLRVFAAVVAALMVWYWLAMQVAYAKVLLPDSYSFLRKLSHAPYAGSTFIANIYTGPVAAMTGTWAYLHADAAAGKLRHDGDVLRLERDTSYLWFADRHTNPAYDHPRYFLCVMQQTMERVNAELLRREGEGPPVEGCGANRLVQLARDQVPATTYPGMTLVEMDTEGPSRVGYLRWAIVRFDW
jgi:hypothetical protein